MNKNQASIGTACFCLGLLSGTVLALLYAPQSGTRTRARIRRKAEEACESADDLRQAVLDEGEELAREGKKIARRGVEVVQQAREAVGV